MQVPWSEAGEKESSSKEDKAVILLTGFEPFGNRTRNGSWEAVRRHHGKTIAGHSVVALQLPVVYDAIASPLKDAVRKHKPLIVISFGEGTGMPRVELIALNGYHRLRPMDNKGRRPPRKKILPSGKEVLKTTLPARKIVSALHDAGFDARTSRDAGGYLCNECFYRLMAAPSPGNKQLQARGFVHLPILDQPDRTGKAYTAARLGRIVKIIVETTLKSLSEAESSKP